MLRLKEIRKEYEVGNTKVEALKGIDLSFRQNEFVSILGPSGCGKTTMLNIIGGLDKYTTGDLFINGRSTKEFKDSDWDVYRNKRIGFIFQSYNLIPHQTILGNVELALTIAGVSKTERTARAKKALDKVGLQGQYNKKPNQLSGGQSQRVAIARALVNDPEILLADEPTGALDTVTSVQIMDLIKEIAKDRLVIMVTHNPELANEYSTRIIKLLDGELQSDSNPFTEKNEIKETNKRNELLKKEINEPNKEKAKMSFFTSFKLSLQNLFTKKARTILTSIAGSIGIIGVSLVLALSFGLQTQIDNMQNDMLSGNPIEIRKTAMDINAMQNMMTPEEKIEVIKEAGYINVNSMVEALMKRADNAGGLMVNNTITKDYVEYLNNAPSNSVAAILLNYGLDLTNNLYTDVYKSNNDNSDQMSLSTLRMIYTDMLKKTQYSEYSSLIGSLSENFMQVPNNEEYIKEQYNMLHGNYSKNKDEIMIVVNSDNQLNDLLLAQLGYYSQEEFINLIYKAGKSPLYNPSLERSKLSYDELIGKEFTWYPNDVVFNDPTDALAPFTYNSYQNDNFKNGLKLKITGILEPKEDINFGSLTSGFYYTEELANYVIESNNNSKITSYLKNNNLDAFYGMKTEVEQGSGVYKDLGITATYSFEFEGETYQSVSYLGKTDMMSAMLGSMMGGSVKEIPMVSLNELGGSDVPNQISIYPTDFENKKDLITYLDKWNQDIDIKVFDKVLKKADRVDIIYTDTLSIVMTMMSSLIDVITIALIGFTALSLLVSCVMIAIITYVSVVERTKEIGVIRSLGGRKKDVSYLFNAETFIIGATSGLIGVGVTYILSLAINGVVKPLVGMSIAIFPIHYALIMLLVSILLTVLSGLIPSRSAAKKDPVVALRTE
ncbi:ABC transporter ATP-binding protein/permease [Haploplasma axanthum]|uniref:ABC transporter ATP-binding protein n=1 Tax=Haploplasma axanthum TaxID=29552 RepID=A0A449BBK1_HAPAX|nr:ABC transporter ATP-binding protein/permease [Haploplasma axanthum]VEU79834.1 ABC transporter ATP-binding protein [Haploplasma axanthum]